MQDIRSKVNREDRENARIDRSRATNPASSDPGMGDFDWDGDSLGSSPSQESWGGGSSSGGGSSPFGGSPLGSSPLNGGTPGMMPPMQQSGIPQMSPWGGQSSWFNQGGMQQQQQEKQKSSEDKFFDGIKLFFSGFINLSKDFVTALKQHDNLTQLRVSKSIIITGGIVCLVGLVILLFDLRNTLALDMFIGGLLALAAGAPMFMVAYDTFVKSGMKSSTQDMQMPQQEVANLISSDFEDEDDISIFDNEDDDLIDPFEDSDDERDPFTSEDIDSDIFNIEETNKDDIENNMDKTLSLVDSNNGMLTRQYLYDSIFACLMNMTPNFDKARVIPENSEEFDSWDAIVQSSASRSKPKGDEVEMPYLISVKERLFYFLLEIKRVNWLKNINAFTNEIVSICGFDKDSGNMDTSIFGIGNTVGDSIYVKIMKGDTAIVTIKDTYKNVVDEIKNPKNYIPVVLGVDAEGNVVWRDFKDINSILITGMPRSGKSWHVQMVIAQMAFFLKPSELNFYFLDPKDQISDFRAMQMPHIRKFVSKDEEILRELRNIVKVEGPRRKKLIGAAGFVNIWDFKKRNPDVELPLIYIVIDEVITLSERMNSETKDEFQGLLLELVSQLPALGIRIFMIPHVVKDNIIKKSITQLIPCRISVRGDSDHIEHTVGVKNFKHKLLHQGDMAVRLNNDEPMFVHSAVLTNTNEGNQEFFEFLRKLWFKLEPESIEGSVYHLEHKFDKIGSSESTNRSNIVYETPSTKNNSSKQSQRLASSDMDELLSLVDDDEDSSIYE